MTTTTNTTNNATTMSKNQNQKGEITMTTATERIQKIQKFNEQAMQIVKIEKAERYDLADLNKSEGMAYFLYLELKRTVIKLQREIGKNQKDMQKALEDDCISLYKDIQKQVSILIKEKSAIDKYIEAYGALKIEKVARVALYHYGTRNGSELIMSEEDVKRLDAVIKNIQNLAENHMAELSKADMDKDFHSDFYRHAKKELKMAWELILPDEKNIPNAENMSALIHDIAVYRMKSGKDTNIVTNNTEIKKLAGIKRTICKLLAAKIADRDVHFARREELDKKVK